MLLVCYKNHFNHRICRVLEKPLDPPLPAPRFKAVAIYLHMFTFTFSDAVIRSREAQTSEKRACVPIVEQGKLSSQEKKP